MSNSNEEELTDSDYDYDQWPCKTNSRQQRVDSEENESENEQEEEEEEVTATKTATTSSKNESSGIFKKLTRTYINEIFETLEKHQEVSYANALELNKEMQNKLATVRTKIQELLNKVVNRYQQNQETLIRNMEKVPMKRNRYGKTIRGRTFFIRGNTFFKDENMRSCPNNEDYITRSRNGELFPMDFDLVARHIWSITDKMGIVRGIKEQILSERSEHISDKNVQLTTLLEQVGPDFEIDWKLISSHNLSYRHTPTSCKAMWDVYLQPALNHDAFSQTENERLLEAAQKHTNWATIAKEVGKRSDYQCFLQYHTTLYNRSRGWQRWDKKDDKRLLDAIEAAKCNGVINWTQVAFQFPQKSKASLQQRYQYAINPAVSHAPFTPEEDLLLLATVEEYGKNFARIPRTIFPNRSIVQLRSRYKNTLQNRDKNKPWSLQDDEFLMEFVKLNGASSWKKLEEAFDYRHTRIACRQRYTVIQKHLNNDSNATLNSIVRRGPRSLRSDVTPKNWHEKVEQLRANPTAIEDEAEAKNQSKKRKKNTAKARKLEKSPKEDSNGRNKKPRMAEKKKIYEENIQLELENEVEVIENMEETVCTNQSQDVINNSEQTIPTPTELPTTTTTTTTKSNNNQNKKKKKQNKNKSINKPIYSRKSQNPIYVERLRANDLGFHNFLKYAYNFRFGRDTQQRQPSEYDVEELEKAKQCLGFQMPQEKVLAAIKKRNKKKSKKSSVPKERNENVTAFIRNSVNPGTTLEPSNSYQMPPNFSTITTLRALCTLSADHAKQKEKEKTQETENPNPNPNLISERGLEAIHRFRQRFHNLLYKTAVLSRLPPSTFEQNHFINQLNKQTEGEFHISSADDSMNNSANATKSLNPTSAVASPQGGVKVEFTEETETVAPVIKTEFDFEAYKEVH